MPVPPSPLPSGLGDAFTAHDARAAGVSRGRLRASDLEAPFRGVRAVRGSLLQPTEREEDAVAFERIRRQARAYATTMVSHAFFAGRTALALRGVIGRHGPTLEVAVLSPLRAPRMTGVCGRRISPELVDTEPVDTGLLGAEHRGRLLIATPATAWAMLAAEVGEAELVRLGDAIVRIPRDRYARHHPELQIASIEDLAAAVERGRRPGIRRLRRALERVRVGSMSRLETDFRLSASDAGLPEPDLDVEIRDGRGRLIGIADAAYRPQRVLVEVEGDHHRTDRHQWARDIEKHAAYAAEGWELVRLTSAHIRGAQASAPALLRATLRRRGWRP